MLEGLIAAFARLEKVHIAQSEEERSAIARMRYRIYVEEKNEVSADGADHIRRELRTPEDDLPDATHFYIGSPANLRGSLRVRVWKPGQIPRNFFERYSLDRFPGIEKRTVANVAYLMTIPNLRGTADVVALTSGALEYTVAEHGAEMLIADCAPGLLESYRRLGLRPYGAQLLSMSRGVQIPVADIASDLERHQQCGSPWYPVLRRLAARGKLPKSDYLALLGPFTNGGGVESNPARVLAAIEEAVARGATPFFARLSPRTRRRIAKNALLFEVEAGVDVLVEGFAGNDIFVILEGEFELCQNASRVGFLGVRDVIGEVAFFRENGRRSASVRSTVKSTLIHIRAKHLRRLAAAHPADGVEIYDSLAVVLADRLASWGLHGRREGRREVFRHAMEKQAVT